MKFFYYHEVTGFVETPWTGKENLKSYNQEISNCTLPNKIGEVASFQVEYLSCVLAKDLQT